jgi:ABC-type polar amino acid transport system ATPase subunit
MINEVLDVMRKLAKMGMTMAAGSIVEVATPEVFFSNPETDRARGFLSKVLNH